MNLLIAWLLSTSPVLVNGDRLLFQVRTLTYLPYGEVCMVHTLRYLNFEEVQRYTSISAAEWERMRQVADAVHHFTIKVDRSRA